jgi:hypothetical protein
MKEYIIRPSYEAKPCLKMELMMDSNIQTAIKDNVKEK